MAKTSGSAEAAAGENETKEKTASSAEAVVKSGFKKVKDFCGAYGNARFDDDGAGEIDDETLDKLKKEFPNAEIEVLDSRVLRGMDNRTYRGSGL